MAGAAVPAGACMFADLCVLFVAHKQVPPKLRS